MLTQSEYIRLRRRLRTAQTKLRKASVGLSPLIQDPEDPRVELNQKLLYEAQDGLAVFSREGFPDDWHSWERAAEDAYYALRFVRD
jgi:hypothetical protein